MADSVTSLKAQSRLKRAVQDTRQVMLSHSQELTRSVDCREDTLARLEKVEEDIAVINARLDFLGAVRNQAGAQTGLGSKHHTDKSNKVSFDVGIRSWTQPGVIVYRETKRAEIPWRAGVGEIDKEILTIQPRDGHAIVVGYTVHSDKPHNGWWEVSGYRRKRESNQLLVVRALLNIVCILVRSAKSDCEIGRWLREGHFEDGVLFSDGLRLHVKSAWERGKVQDRIQ